MPAILEFPTTRTAPKLTHAPDLAYASLPLLNRLRDALVAVANSQDEQRRNEERATRKQRAWGVPKLFFFDKIAQAEYAARRGKEQSFPHPPRNAATSPTRGEVRRAVDFFTSPLAGEVDSRSESGGGAATLADLLDDTHLLLAESLDVRRSARATPGLYNAAKRVGSHLEPARRLAELLRMPEGEAIRVIHPAARAGYRVLTHGVATVRQFHTLLADTISEDLPGERPSAEAVNAAGAVDPFRTEVVTEVRFQFLRPTALMSDGTMPEGFRGSDHWYWGDESLAEFPLDNGERTVLIDEPTFAAEWAVDRPFPRLPAEVDVLEVMERSEVEAWLRKRCPDYAPARRVRERVAA